MWRAQRSSHGRLIGAALAAVLASGSLFLACGDDGNSPTRAVIASIAIDPPTAPPRIMAPGTTAQLTAVAYDEAGDAVDVKFTWATSDATIVTVNSGGLVTALAPGAATITASAQQQTGAVLITVAQPGALVEITPADPFLDQGATLQLSATVFDADGNELDLPAIFTSDAPAVATVTPAGLLTGVTVGQATIVATSGEVSGSVIATVTAPVASVTLTPAVSSISIDDTLQLSAVVADAQGNVLNRPPAYTSSDPAVAVVDESGEVVGKGVGMVTITASAGGKHGNSSVNVQPKVAAVTISGSTGNQPLEIGLTRQLTATVTDIDGNVLDRHVTWSSSSNTVATVDQTGLVTGVAAGDVIITAAVRDIAGTLALKVTGESETTAGNNLSWPVVFADGIGLTGSPVATDPGVRPLTGETEAYAELIAVTPTNPAAAFFFTGNVKDATTGYYLQGTASTWRAQIVDGTGQSAYDASVYWGDNLAGGTGNLGVDHPIRVEVALSTTDGVSLDGYSMPYVANPSSPEEVQGTDGATLSEIPLIYSAGPTLTIEQLDGPGGNVVAEISSTTYKAEINVGGRIIYGAQFKPTVAGTYRLRFILASGANVRLTEVGNATGNITIVNPNECAIEIQVTP